MKTYATLLTLLFIVLNSFSQDLNNSQNVITQSGNMLYTFDVSDKSIEGTPYIQEDFLPAKVSAKNNEIFNLRYNAVNDEIEIESTQEKNPTINKNISGITITFLKDNKTYKSMTYFNNEGNSVNGFLVVLTENNSKVKLFANERIKFVERKPAKSSYQGEEPAKFDRLNDSYYIAINNEIAKPLSTNKKEIAALFPQYEKEILKYISSERLNVRKQDDLVNLVNHLNQLSQ